MAIQFYIDPIGLSSFDLCWSVNSALAYHKWLNSDPIYKKTTRKVKTAIPVGSIEFVEKWLSDYHGKSLPKPLNIPMTLNKPEYTLRKCVVSSKADIPAGKWFVKSNTKAKKFTEILDNVIDIPDDEYLISEVVEFESEWRCFVVHDFLTNKHKLVGLQNYLGDFTMMPSIEVINNMIRDYIDAPVAYTLDVGIIKNKGTAIIECHHFYSCGLYGFSDKKILPYMLSVAWKELISDSTKY